MIQEAMPYRRLFTVLCLAWAVLYFNVLFGGRVLPWDAIDQFYPTVYFNAHSLRSGLAPWWNPYMYAGYPQIGDPQGMLFSPLLMAWMMLLAHPGAVWFSWGVLLHVLMGGAAMLELSRRHGADAVGALVGAIVFMAGGVAASRLEHTPDVIAYAYVPVVLLAIRHLLDRPGLRRGCLLGLAAGAMVTQLVQVTYLFALMIAAYAGIALVRRWKEYDGTARTKACFGFAVAAALAALIGLPQLAFSWAAMSLSNRRDLPLALAAAGSLDGRALRFLVDPNAFDGLRHPQGAPIDVPGAFLYVGAIPTLALFALGRAWRSGGHRVAIACFGALLAVALVYMFGTNTPVYGWLYTWMPGLVHFRRPEDAAYLFNFALAALSAVAASWIDWRSRKEVTLLLAVAAAWLAVLAWSLHHHRGAPFVAVVVTVLACWRMRKEGGYRHAAWWVVLMLVADYRSFNLNGTFNETANGASRFAKHPVALYLADALAKESGGSSARMSTTHTYTIWDNMGGVLGIASVQGYNPLRYALYGQWYGARENSNLPVPVGAYNARESTLDDLLGARYLVVGHRTDLPPFTPPPGYRKVQAFRDVDLWRNDTIYARFLNPGHARLIGVGALPDVADFTATDFASTLWLTPRDAEDEAGDRALVDTCTGHVDARPVSSTPTRIDLQTTAASSGWIVAGELDHPGWTADIDGQPVPVHRANGMFRAVCVPAGAHRLSFAFHPWTMVAYAWRHRG